MGETELIQIIRDVHAQYATLFGEIITINFAMIVAIYYFLHRAPLLFRAAAFAFYAIGMLALIALTALPPDRRSPFATAILAFHQSWLSQATSFFLNASLWVLFAVVAYLLFWWRGDPNRSDRVL